MDGYTTKEVLLFAKDNVDMSIVPNSVNIKLLKDYLISFYYYPGEKRAELMVKKGIELSDTLLQEMLNAELKKYNFTDYRKNIMALSFNKDKEIIIPEFKVNDGKIDFEIEEDKKTLYLISKKV